MKKIYNIFFMLLVLSFSITLKANAYELLGGKWSNSNVKNLKYFISSSNDKVNSFWNEGIYNWNSTSTPVNFIKGTPQNYSVGLGSYIDKNTSTDGYAVLYPSSTSNPYSGAYGYLNEAKTDYYVADKGIGLAGHELGHVLGLAHVTNKAIMIDNSKDRYDVYKIVKPQSDDVNGINRLY